MRFLKELYDKIYVFFKIRKITKLSKEYKDLDNYVDVGIATINGRLQHSSFRSIATTFYSRCWRLLRFLFLTTSPGKSPASFILRRELKLMHSAVDTIKLMLSEAGYDMEPKEEED